MTRPITVEIDTGGRDVALDRLEAAARAALRARGIERAHLSVALLGDDDMRRLNREHLDHDRPTDVIAFALWEEGDPLVVGDVYLGVDQAGLQADDEGIPLVEELLRLVVHGTLHVTGMDHPDAPEARADSPMYRLQERLVGELVGEGGEGA